MTAIFYDQLAEWWPLISPVDEYAGEARYLSSLLNAHRPVVRFVLELGSGGGHLAHHLTDRFDLTLSDLSPAMLDRSRELNPTCRHVHGDMRTLRLDRTFDAVLVHDAIDYMTTEGELTQVFTTARQHLELGGLLIIVPDHTAEIFEPCEDVSGSEQGDRAVRLLEWTRDPDPSDTWIETDYVFVLHDGDAPVRIAHEIHRTGLFRRATWLELLTAAGFAGERVVEETQDQRQRRDVFVAVRTT